MSELESKAKTTKELKDLIKPYLGSDFYFDKKWVSLEEAQRREFALIDQLDIVTKRNSELAGKVEAANKILDEEEASCCEGCHVRDRLKVALDANEKSKAFAEG